jgi:hypothetical protein
MRTPTKLLRLSAIGAWILVCTLCFSPLAVMAADGGTTTDAVVAAPTAPAATPAPAPTAEPKADPQPAPKAEPKTEEKGQAWWQAVLMPVLSVLGMFIAAFLAAGLRKLVVLIEKKWSIDIPDSVEKMMYEKARWAIGWVEEKAEKRLLYGDGKKTESAAKVTEVVDLLEKFAQGIGYGEEWQRSKIEALAEGVLHLERDKSVGSNGDRGKKLTEKKRIATGEVATVEG